MPDQSNASHFIKRLCGLPGDTIEIRQPELLINGKPAEESTIQRVAACKAPYNSTGYNRASEPVVSILPGTPYSQQLEIRERLALIKFEYDQLCISESKPVLELKNDKDDANAREYAALGDNTTNSKDTRYWGPVRQFNVLGPAVMTLWPFSSHWGSIE